MNKIPIKTTQPIAKVVGPSVIVASMLPKPEFTDQPSPSIIHPKFSGLNLITGFRGKGKSSLAMSWDNPNNILMLDFDDKEEDGASELGIKAYFPVAREVISKAGSNFDIDQIYYRTVQILDAVPENRFTTLVIDNAQDFQEACVQRIAKDPELIKKFGLKAKNVETGSYGGALPGAKHLIRNVARLAQSKGIRVISVVFQLKPAWDKNGPLFDKWKTTDVSVWHELSRLTLVLVDPMMEHFPVPRALVMKEAFSERKWSDEAQKVIQTRRIPQAIPKADPTSIYEYLDKPANFKEPKPGETVTALELAPYTPTFSKEQLFLSERAARAQKELGLTGGDENG